MWRMVVQSGSSRGDTKPQWKLQTPTEIGGNVTQLQVMSWPALVHYFRSIHLLPLQVYPRCHANEESSVKLTSTVLWTDTLASSHNPNIHGLGVFRLHYIIFLRLCHKPSVVFCLEIPLWSLLQWGSNLNLLAANNSNTVLILCEHVMSAHFSHQVAAVQLSPTQLNITQFHTGLHFSLQSDIHVRGVCVTKVRVEMKAFTKYPCWWQAEV